MLRVGGLVRVLYGKSGILPKSLLGLKFQTFYRLCARILDWLRSKIFPIVLYHFDQNYPKLDDCVYIYMCTCIIIYTYSTVTRLRVFNSVRENENRMTGKENHRRPSCYVPLNFRPKIDFLVFL